MSFDPHTSDDESLSKYRAIPPNRDNNNNNNGNSIFIDIGKSSEHIAWQRPSDTHRVLVVLALAFGAPIQATALFLSSADVVLAMFGIYVASIIVTMTSPYVMRELAFERKLEFSLSIASVLLASLVVAFSAGVGFQYWSLFGNPTIIQPTTLKRPLNDAKLDTDLLSVFDLSHLSFEVARNHVGQHIVGNTYYCVAPLAARKQLAKVIGGRDDVPSNWAVCSGDAPTPHNNNNNNNNDNDNDNDDEGRAPFHCGDYYRAATGSDADRATILHGSDEPTALLRCLRRWASATLGHDVAPVSRQLHVAGMQAAKDALQNWAPLTDESENPLSTFDDDEDLKHLTFVSLDASCCEQQASEASARTLWSFCNS